MSENDIERTDTSKKILMTKFISWLKDFLDAFSSRGISTCASSVAFFFFMSLIPLIILLAMLLPILGIDLSMITKTITALTPDSVDGLMTRIIREAFSASARILPVTLLLLIWSSSAGMLALIHGLNRVYQAQEHRNSIVLIMLSILYTAILIVLFVSIMYLMLFNASLRTNINNFFEAHNFTVFRLEGSRYRIAFIVSALVFMVMYTFIPAGKRSFLLQFPGAAFTSLGFMVFSQIFSIYLRGANKYTLFYGSLSGIAIFLFWLYGCFYIFLIGAYLNEYFEEAIRELAGRAKERVRKRRKKE